MSQPRRHNGPQEHTSHLHLKCFSQQDGFDVVEGGDLCFLKGNAKEF